MLPVDLLTALNENAHINDSVVDLKRWKEF